MAAIELPKPRSLGTTLLIHAHQDLRWFVGEPNFSARQTMLGFRCEPGGVHLSKTMMLHDLSTVMEAREATPSWPAEIAVGQQNVLRKSTGSARRLALRRLNTLYGVASPFPVQASMLSLWPRTTIGKPLLALLCALAREPLLRTSATVILATPEGSELRSPELATIFAEWYPGRYSGKMIASLARNCASSWTQAGHLRGKVNKRRARAQPSPEVAAYAALLGSLAGYGGPALLASPWMRLLDQSEFELIALLRRAEGQGLIDLKVGGGVVQLEPLKRMAHIAGIAALVDG